ncbi:MAG: hypothetical protein Aurels2KO_03730 [Aureliella sp.]
MALTNRRPQNRDGKITLLAIVFLLLIVVLMGLLGNVGHVTSQKLELQNAADSIAFSSTLSLARGMNTVTTANHLVGEATALSVLHESLGGPELRLGLRKNTPENRSLDSRIRGLKVSSPIGRIPNPYVPPFLTSIDKRLIEFVARQTSPAGSGQQTEFATLYDSRMTIKRGLSGWMTAKSIANLAYLVPPPIGYIPAIAAYATHIAGSVNIAMYGKEWLLLRVLAVYAKAAAPVQDRVFDSQVIPALCKFSSETAGVSLASDNAPTDQDEPGFAAESAIDVAESVSETLKVKGVLFPDEELRLPVEPEPKPDGSGMPSGWKEVAGQPGWGTDRTTAFPEVADALGKIESKLRKAVGKMRSRTTELEKAIRELQEILEDVQDRMNDVSGELKGSFEREVRKLNELIATAERERNELEARSREIEQQRESLGSTTNELPNGRSQNLSLEHIPTLMNPEQERLTQWVRACMPSLDQMRAPILGLMNQHLKKCKAAEHFEKWTNRYALIAAWRFRSGQRLRRTGTASASWSKQAEPLSLLVLQGAYRQSEPYKGLEDWTGNGAADQREAESLFTVLGVAHREFEPLFSSTVSPAPQSNGIATVALGMLYNANSQTSIGSGLSQPLLGWDTLNWDQSAMSLPEWGAPASRTSVKWPWELFSYSNSEPLVKLNWQAKLMPVTRSRLEELAETGDLDESPLQSIQLAIDYAELLTH